MSVFKKLVFYKRAFQFLLIFNILTIVSGFVAAFSYFTSKATLSILVKDNQQRIEKLTEIRSHAFFLATDDNSDGYMTRFHLESLKEKIQNYKGSSLGDFTFSPQKMGIPPKFLHTLNERISKEEATLLAQTSSAVDQISAVTKQLVLVGFVTFLFGILVPALVFRTLQKEWDRARMTYEERVSKWLAEWLNTWRSYGEKPWKDSSFWLNVTALSVETFAPKFNHPMASFAAEFAPIFRRELKKADERRPEKPIILPVGQQNQAWNKKAA